MTTETGATSSQKTYRSRVGLIADSPNFPGDWQQIVEKIRLADELGFDSVWLGESWGYELFTSMADVIRVTRRIKVGAGIANVYSRTPALLASTVATLDERSGGRIILGIGPSGANVIEHWHGVKFEKPLKRTQEYIEIIRMILRREKLVYHGEFFHLERGFKLLFTPFRDNLPIYIAAMGPKNIRLTGELGDGILPIYWPEHDWPLLRTLLDEGSQSVGRSPRSVAIAPYTTTVLLSENAGEREMQEARLRVATPLAYYIGKMGVYYAQMLTQHGFGEDVQAVLEGWKQGMKTAVQAVSPRMLDAVSLIGTPHEVVARLDQWAESGVDEPLLSMPAGSIEETEAQLGALMAALKA
jgi:F420-dependent oxidoreductase-like protein